MIKRIFLSLAILFSISATKAATGDWRLYSSYHNATFCEIIDDNIYVLSSGALYSYGKADEEIRTYDKISHLSDTKIAFISYSKAEEALVIVYENANIDLLYKNESVYNISDFKNKTLTNKTINGIKIIDENLYLSTSFGIVVLNLDKKEFTNTYTLNKNVLCSYIFGEYIYTGTDEGLYRGKLSDNLLDKSKWTQLNNYKTNCLDEMSGELYCVIEPYGVYTIDTEKNRLTLIAVSNDTKLKYMYRDGEQIFAGNPHKLIVINSDKNFTTYTLDGKSNFIKTDGNTLWKCKGYDGLIKCSIKEQQIAEETSGILPNSPIRNYCEFMKYTDGQLLVAGGNLNYFDVTFYDGTIMKYDCNEDYWYNFPEDIIKEKTNLNYQNICSIDEDPNEKGHYFASSFGYGIYEFRDGEFIEHYNHENSALKSVWSSGEYMSRYVRVSKVKFDKNGNLWAINTGTENIIKILKTDGSWESLYYKQIEKKPTISDILFDSRGWVWLVSLQSDPGLFCIKPGTTLYDTSDDTTGWFSKFTNQDGTSYEIGAIYAIAEDREGKIWVGTSNGLFTIDNPKTFFDKGIFTQIKIPRNDGSGLADYLMNGVNIQCIFVDGANRKWIGTKDNGIYLIDSDGSETVYHFTTENSPLPSNGIVSVAVNDENGEIFIGTDNGIISFMGDATKPADNLDENNIHAYPNPVRADYSGDITVTGLTFDCNVKIVDSAGYLIFEGISTGGSFKWDGRNKKGEKVASGVYYVLTYDEEGNEGASTKILVVR